MSRNQLEGSKAATSWDTEDDEVVLTLEPPPETFAWPLAVTPLPPVLRFEATAAKPRPTRSLMRWVQGLSLAAVAILSIIGTTANAANAVGSTFDAFAPPSIDLGEALAALEAEHLGEVFELDELPAGEADHVAR